MGPKEYKDLPDTLSQADLFINVSRTGSIDKAVLEAMALNIPVLTSNEAFKELLPEKYYCDDKDLRSKIIEFYNERPNDNLRQIVEEKHSLTELVKKLFSKMKGE